MFNLLTYRLTRSFKNTRKSMCKLQKKVSSAWDSWFSVGQLVRGANRGGAKVTLVYALGTMAVMMSGEGGS